MKNKGFTLVELLAILVILAVIAIITVPRITRMIEDSKKDAANVSALGYLDAIEKYYMENSRFGSEKTFRLNGEYLVSNGVLKNDDEEHHISVTGDAPTSGSFYIDHGQVVSGCLTIGVYKVTIANGSPTTVEEGECSVFNPGSFIANLEGHVEADGYKYLDSPIVLYYDPTTGQRCNTYVSSNSTNGVKTGCMKWYIYSLKDSVMYAILDHSIVSSVGCSSADFENSTILGAKLDVSNMGGYDYGSNGATKGPLTALNSLKENTSSWVTSVKGDYNEYQADSGNSHYHVDFSNYKARLITIEEVAYFEKCSIASRTYISTRISPGYERWDGTLTISPNANYGNLYWIIIKDSTGSMTIDSTGKDTSLQVRPVISLSTSMLSAVIND